MAAVGMKYLTFAPVYTETAQSAIVYSTGQIAEHAISGDITYNYDEASLYGDDKLAEYCKALTGYDIELGLTELDDTLSALIGIEKAVQEGSGTTYTVYKMNPDNTTSVGVGFMQTLIVNGTKSYVGYWFHKVTFSIENETAQTRGETIEWQTPTLTGKGWGVELDASTGVQYRDRRVFTAESDALAWLKSKAGVI